MGCRGALRHRGCAGHTRYPVADHLHRRLFGYRRDIARDLFRRDGADLPALLGDNGLSFAKKMDTSYLAPKTKKA